MAVLCGFRTKQRAEGQVSGLYVLSQLVLADLSLLTMIGATKH